MKNVTELLKAVEKGDNPIDAVASREFGIIKSKNLLEKETGLHYVLLLGQIRADLQETLIGYQELYKKFHSREQRIKTFNSVLNIAHDIAKMVGKKNIAIPKDFIPEFIKDFSFSGAGQGESFLRVYYFDDRINGNINIQVDLKEFGAWIISKGYNKGTTSPTGPEQEPEEVIHSIEDFFGIYLEKWHVSEFLIERSIF